MFRQHVPCPCRLQSQTVVSPLLCKTTDRSSMISMNKHFIVPLHVPSLCAGLRAFLLQTSAWSRKWEGRKGGRGEKSEGGGQNQFYFFFFFLNKANFGTEIWQ